MSALARTCVGLLWLVAAALCVPAVPLMLLAVALVMLVLAWYWPE